MFIVLFALVPVFHAYIGMRLLPDLSWGVTAFWIGVSVLFASSLLIPLGMLSRRMPNPRADLMAWVGFLLMGAFSSLLVLTLLRDIALTAAALVDLIHPSAWLDEALHEFRTGSARAVPILAALLTLLGFANARRQPAVRNVDVAIAGLPAALHGFSIAQITDIHVGPTIKGPYLERIVNAVNSLEADLIAVTGDLVDGSVSHLAAEMTSLSRLTARHGAFFVTGNHEYYSGVEGWVVHLRGLGMRVLMNEHVVLRHAGEALVVAGVTDFSAHHFYPDQRSDPAAALAGAPLNTGLRLLLAHQPRSAFAAEAAGFQLQLSGHTHGGQFLPWNFLVRLQQPFTAGLVRLGDLWIYTSRGSGYWGPPKRLGAPSEITRIRLMAG